MLASHSDALEKIPKEVRLTVFGDAPSNATVVRDTLSWQLFFLVSGGLNDIIIAKFLFGTSIDYICTLSIYCFCLLNILQSFLLVTVILFSLLQGIDLNSHSEFLTRLLILVPCPSS